MATLTRQRLAQLRRDLERRRALLLEEIRTVQSDSGDHPYAEVAGSVPDTGDEAVADLLMDVDHAMVDRDVQEVRDIEAALRRMNDGDYGRCIGCGGDIEPARLDAYPTAKRCQPCQAQYEKTYQHGGTPTL